MKLRNFIYIYFPLLLTFVIGKLIFQTDMIMLGLIDGESVAAFGIPSKIMIFDMIVAFSFAPVVSVFVASENNKEKRKEVISYSISVALIAGFILTFIGIIFYPFFIKASILDEKIYSYAKFATLLLTISIPVYRSEFFLDTKNGVNCPRKGGRNDKNK